MKNYSANFILPLLFAACLLSGCGKKQENPEPETSSVFDDMRYYPQETLKEGTSLRLSEDPAAVWVYSSCITDHGVFFFSEEDHLLKYEEWESGNVYPLCAKSNCLHNSSDCTAWFSPSEAWLPTAFYYNGESLFFELNGETGETVFYRQNLDGSDRRQIFTEKSNFSDGVVYDDDLVYYLTYTTAPDEETETERVNTESTLTYYLNQGNLTTGETKRLSYSWNDTMVYMSLLGKYENQLALRHSVVTGEGEDDWPVVEETLFLLNLDNGEMTGIGQGFSQRNDMFAGDAIPQGIFGTMKLDTESEEVRTQYGHEYYPTTITVDSLAEECSYQLPMQVWNIWDLMILDGKVLYYIPDEQTDELVPAAYDLQTGEEIILPSVFRNFDIFGETGQWFYGRVYETDESSEKVRILKSNFYAGNPVYIEVSEEW